MDHLDEGDASFQVGAEVGVSVPVLRFAAVADTVGKDGFQEIEVAALQAGSLVDDDAGEVLAHRLAHDAGLVVIDGEAFFQYDAGRVRAEAVDHAVKGFLAREGEVIQGYRV